jgi:hypothetical protein
LASIQYSVATVKASTHTESYSYSTSTSHTACIFRLMIGDANDLHSACIACIEYERKVSHHDSRSTTSVSSADTVCTTWPMHAGLLNASVVSVQSCRFMQDLNPPSRESPPHAVLTSIAWGCCATPAASQEPHKESLQTWRFYLATSSQRLFYPVLNQNWQETATGYHGIIVASPTPPPIAIQIVVRLTGAQTSGNADLREALRM